jgi:hypothetical protein
VKLCGAQFNGDDLWRCSRRGCKWIGTEDQRLNQPHPRITNRHVTISVCPRCGCDSFRASLKGDQISDLPGTTPVRPENTRTIYWKDAAIELPDDGMTVLVITQFDGGGVWMGYHNAGLWFCVEGGAIEVTAWAELPEGPAPLKEGK